MICDSHIHVFGPPDRYPVRSEARYAFGQSLLADYQPFARRAGIRRIVVVQPSTYAQDNDCTLDASAALGENGRAVVDIDAAAVTDDELADMHRKGARGARLNVPLALEPDDDAVAAVVARALRVAARIAPLGWHVEMLTPGWMAPRVVAPLCDLPAPCCFAHLGGMGAAGRDGFDIFLRSLSAARGRCWVKLSAFYRVSRDPLYRDVEPLVRELVAAAPDRMLWGTDFPHPKFRDTATPESQLSMLERCVPDEGVRRRILIDNPARLYGFGAAG